MKSRGLLAKYQVVRFMIVGGGAALVHYLIYWMALKVSLPINIAYYIGLILGLVVNFFGSNLFTFHTKPTWSRAVKFGISNIVNFAIHALLLRFLVWIEFPEQFIPPLIYTIAFPLNFLLIRLSLMGRKGKKSEDLTTIQDGV